MIDLVAGDVIAVDLGMPLGSEAGFVRPAVIISASASLRRNLATIFVVPCTTRNRGLTSHISLVPDLSNGLTEPTWAQCEHLRSIGRIRCLERLGNVGVVALEQIREVVALLIDAR